MPHADDSRNSGTMDSDKSESTLIKETTHSTRRQSHMSVENPLSPVSDGSGDSHDGDSIHEEEEEYQPSFISKSEKRENCLRPHLSHTSSVGGVTATQVGLDRTWTGRSSATANDVAYEVDFVDNDKTNPQCWPLWYKSFILLVMSYSTTAVVLYSTSYTSALPGMEDTFPMTNTEGIAGMTTYLMGIAVGSVILAPLSEMYGRRPIYIVAMALFVVFVIPCALANNIATILAARFFGAFCASAMIGNAPGSVNDIVDEEHRALAFSIWSIGPMNGPGKQLLHSITSPFAVLTKAISHWTRRWRLRVPVSGMAMD